MHSRRTVDIKLIQPVVHIKQPVHEVRADSKMESIPIRIASCSEFTCVQAHKFRDSGLYKARPVKEPLFRSARDRITVRVQAHGIVAIADEVR